MEVLTKLNDAAKWAYQHARLTLELVLVLILLFLSWRYNRKVEELDQANAEHGQLAQGLSQQITVANGQIEILKREKGKVIVQKVFVPPEGSIVVKEADWVQLNIDYIMLQSQLASGNLTPEQRKALEKQISELLAKIAALMKNGQGTTVTIKDKGLTLRPGFGAEWAGYGLSPRLDIKWAYFKRYSVLVGGGKDGLDISVSRHLDDLLWWHPMNVELFSGYRLFHTSSSLPIVVGLRANF
jgi:hypothetical protein